MLNFIVCEMFSANSSDPFDNVTRVKPIGLCNFFVGEMFRPIAIIIMYFEILNWYNIAYFNNIVQRLLREWHSG